MITYARNLQLAEEANPLGLKPGETLSSAIFSDFGSKSFFLRGRVGDHAISGVAGAGRALTGEDNSSESSTQKQRLNAMVYQAWSGNFKDWIKGLVSSGAQLQAVMTSLNGRAQEAIEKLNIAAPALMSVDKFLDENIELDAIELQLKPDAQGNMVVDADEVIDAMMRANPELVAQSATTINAQNGARDFESLAQDEGLTRDHFAILASRAVEKQVEAELNNNIRPPSPTPRYGAPAFSLN